MYRASNLNIIKILTKELEEVRLEKDGLDGKLAGLLKALKNLDHLIQSQRSDQVKEGVGYNVVPPPAADLYLSHKKDLSWTGLPEFVDDTVTDYSRPSPTVDEIGATWPMKKRTMLCVVPPPSQVYSLLKKDMSWTGLPKFADDTITDYSRPSPSRESNTSDLQNTDSPIVIKTNKVETARKSFVKYDEMYRNTSKSPKVRDNLGKFKPKGDEGYFIGYSMSNKAFRVFNKRNKRVEENLHVEFLENKAIEKGAGPNCTKVLEGSGNPNSTASSSNPPADQMETLTVKSPIPTVSLSVPTACLNDFPKPSSEARLISKRVANQEESPSLDNILSLTNRFEDIIGVTTSSDEANEVEADVRNMETTISASPTPTLRIHKDHPKSQIIGPVDTPIQTRHKSKFPRVRPIGTKWVLNNKIDERGIVVRNKARLVAQGHTQEEGINYDEVFAPVARIKAIRLFLAYASFMGFTVYQMDVKSAFLYGTIDEEVYVMQPPGFQDPAFPAKVYKVEKAMYGLHQAPRAWYGDILKKFRYSDVRSSNTPMDKENPWGKDRTGKDVDLHLYRSMIGSLMYHTTSRPDIMFAVCACARHQVIPKECHLHAVK
nr:retrovirus-related Pol polyprotein from transposon TNT 1-94 [Tanacetum cinerariifolium]